MPAILGQDLKLRYDEENLYCTSPMLNGFASFYTSRSSVCSK